MTSAAERPLLFLDVDGPLIPFGSPAGAAAPVEWAGPRPFIWVDDEINAVDRQWAEAAHPGPYLLHRVDPAEGLTDADFAVLAVTARSFGG
ncbi:hypothetical protein ACIPH4_12980 [Streptomyces tendae]|uniref:hypothetical protein n=1 Tax=Streptomyces tendae TaxID=1932 RepID=UPI003813FD4D